MGIQDRDYYRDDEPGWWAGAAALRVTSALVALLIGVFVLQVVGSNPARGRPDQLLAFARFDADALLRGEAWRLVTPFVVHGRDALLLVALAAWAFWYFGRRVEAAVGARGYLALLLLTAVGVSLAKLAVGAATGFEAGLRSYGSGPLLAAVLVNYVCFCPRERVVVVVAMPGWLFAGLVGALEAVGEFGGGFAASGAVAYPAGMACGLAFFRFHRPAARALGLDRLGASAGGRRKAKLKLFSQADEAPRERDAVDQAARQILGAYGRPAPDEAPVATVDEQFEAKLDQVLEKVSRSGQDSLTADEQTLLRRASEFYKQRRGR